MHPCDWLNREAIRNGCAGKSLGTLRMEMNDLHAHKGWLHFRQLSKSRDCRLAIRESVRKDIVLLAHLKWA